MARQDPLRGFRFLLEIDGITSGGFMRVKGISREIRHESHREGGVNEYEHKLLTQVTYPVLVLERGLIEEDLWKWALDAAQGNVQRKNIVIRLQNEAGEPGQKPWSWQIENAVPVKWTATDLDAQNAQVVVESLEIAHHGLGKGT